MTWAKVDDRLHSHPKSRRAGPAMAVWVMCLSWAADQESDGWLPDWVIDQFDPSGDARRVLIEVGLWDVGEEQPVDVRKRVGEASVLFHDWGTYQPTRAKAVADRAKTAARVAEYRRRERAKGAKERSSGGGSRSP